MSRTRFCRSFLVLMLTFAAATAGAQSFLPGDCVNQGGFCDASNTCIRYDPNIDDVLLEVRIGTCDFPLDIGGSIDAAQPVFTGPFVTFQNVGRSDFVVSSNDNGSTSGTKKLKVRVVTPTGMARLKISRLSGSAGSAMFDNNSDTIQVKNGDTVTIRGGQTSDQARNMGITAMSGGMPIDGLYIFTVFHVEVSGTISGSPDNALPRTVLANSGKPVTLDTLTIRARTMRKAFTDALTIDASGGITKMQPDSKKDVHNGSLDFDRLGHKLVPEILTYGGIVLKGTIVPSKIPQYDFSRSLTPNKLPEQRESFNFRRTKMIHEYFYDKDKFAGQLSVPCTDGTPDDSSDTDEDLIPKNGGVWTFDTPLIINPAAFRPVQQLQVDDGRSLRGIYQFLDWVDYAGVRVSRDFAWSWRWTYVNPQGTATFAQDPTRGGKDNTMMMGLTPMVPPCGEDIDPDGASLRRGLQPQP